MAMRCGGADAVHDQLVGLPDLLREVLAAVFALLLGYPKWLRSY